MNYISDIIINTLINTSSELQLFLIFLFAFLEGLPVVGSILPGGTIAVFAGSLSASGVFSPIAACILIGIGSFVGDMTGFFLGSRFTNTKIIKKIINEEKHQKMWDLFDKHIALISIFGKLIPVVRSTPSILAGARGQKARKYIFYSFIGSIIWSVVSVFVGNRLAIYFGNNILIIIISIIILTIFIFIIRFFIKKIIKRKKAKSIK